MRIQPLALVACALLSCYDSHSMAKEKLVDNQVQIVADLSYLSYKTVGTDYELERYKLDLYLPRAEQGFPVLIWLHGGGLTRGSKSGNVEQLVGNTFAREGIAVASVKYRLSPRAKYPAYVEDVAVTWLGRNIAEHGGDPRALFVAGHSAGGTLAALLALDDQYLVAQASTPSAARGFILISGQLDSHSTIRAERGVSKTTHFIDESVPLFHVNGNAPPLLVIVG